MSEEISKYHPIELPLQDGLPLIEKVEEALKAEIPDLRYIDDQVLALEILAFQYQNRIHQLTQLQTRIDMILDQHEPPADQR